jgi:hypothetical protein
MLQTGRLGGYSSLADSGHGVLRAEETHLKPQCSLSPGPGPPEYGAKMLSNLQRLSVNSVGRTITTSISCVHLMTTGALVDQNLGDRTQSSDARAAQGMSLRFARVAMVTTRRVCCQATPNICVSYWRHRFLEERSLWRLIRESSSPCGVSSS